MAWAITGLPNSATAPIIGKAFFAASLKNSLLLWASFLLFSIVCFAKVITHYGSSGIIITVCKIISRKNIHNLFHISFLTVQIIYIFVKTIYTKGFSLNSFTRVTILSALSAENAARFRWTSKCCVLR